MSADNGIYILKCKDQYRVAHLQGIDNISHSLIDGYWSYNRLVPTRVVEMFGGCKYTINYDMALRIANNWNSSLPICEYGVNVLKYNKTWKHIVEDAKKYAVKELELLRSMGELDPYYKCKEEKLKTIMNMRASQKVLY